MSYFNEKKKKMIMIRSIQRNVTLLKIIFSSHRGKNNKKKKQSVVLKVLFNYYKFDLPETRNNIKYTVREYHFGTYEKMKKKPQKTKTLSRRVRR